MEDVRKLYWEERISLVQLQKISASYWQDSWSTISDCLFALSGFKSHHEYIMMVKRRIR